MSQCAYWDHDSETGEHERCEAPAGPFVNCNFLGTNYKPAAVCEAHKCRCRQPGESSTLEDALARGTVSAPEEGT